MICRDESQIEQQLYDCCVRLQEQTDEYLSVLVFAFCTMRAFSMCVYFTGCASARHDEEDNPILRFAVV